MSGEHTKTPWTMRKNAHGPIDIVASDGRDIVVMYGGGVDESKEANAEFIVTAVNAYASQKAEIERLREVISKCANALGNGAYIAPTASVEFMERLPGEVELRIAALAVR